MSFRYQMMILLLSVSVLPLVFVSVIDILTLRDLADVLARRFDLSAVQLRQESVFVRERVLFDVLVAVVVLCSVVALAWWWVGRFNRRVQPFIDSVVRAGRGDFRDEPLRLDSNDALAKLGRSLRGMLASLRDHQRLTSSLALARRVHESLLPSMPREVCDHRIAARVDSCDFLGGDYYDVLVPSQSPPHALAVVVDICGHGAPSALIAARTQGLLRAAQMRVLAKPSQTLTVTCARTCQT